LLTRKRHRQTIDGSGADVGNAQRDFRKFYEGIKPYVRLAEEYLGVQLPPDLFAMVQQGQMTTGCGPVLKERMDRAMVQTTPRGSNKRCKVSSRRRRPNNSNSDCSIWLKPWKLPPTTGKPLSVGRTLTTRRSNPL
jgi:hypothetical protein